MTSQRSILALRYTPVSVMGGVRKAVGGFLRYVQYRDQHLDAPSERPLDGYLRYVAHRDRTSPQGRVFGAHGDLTAGDRRKFVEFVARSTQGLEPRWVTTKDGQRQDRQRAVYTFVLSPEDWRGLDLRTLARTAMRQLESDAGANGMGPWFAAEHRNTAHHHVHIVLAARREFVPGHYRAFVITRPRLQRMKDAIAKEIERQRSRDLGPRRERGAVAERTKLSADWMRARPHSARSAMRWLPIARARKVGRHALGQQPNRRALGATFFWLKAIARRYSDRMAWELERDNDRAELEGWMR